MLIEAIGLVVIAAGVFAFAAACAWSAQTLKMETGTVEERTILVQPEKPLTPWAEKLTGISNRNLERALSLEDALTQLEAIQGRFLFLDQGFTRPFLENACRRCGKEFSLCFLTLDCLLEQLGIPTRQNSGKLLETLPAPPKSWPDVPPEKTDLVQLYRLTRAVFYQLEETQ